jgi:hypothetical protein
VQRGQVVRRRLTWRRPSFRETLSLSEGCHLVTGAWCRMVVAQACPAPSPLSRVSSLRPRGPDSSSKTSVVSGAHSPDQLRAGWSAALLAHCCVLVCGTGSRGSRSRRPRPRDADDRYGALRITPDHHIWRRTHMPETRPIPPTSPLCSSGARPTATPYRGGSGPGKYEVRSPTALAQVLQTIDSNAFHKSANSLRHTEVLPAVNCGAAPHELIAGSHHVAASW